MAELTDSNPTGVIIVATIIVTGSTVIRDVHEGKTRAAPIVFGFMLAAALLVLAIPLPRFARGLAYMAMVGAFVVNGAAVFGIASGISQSKSPGITGLPKGPPAAGTRPVPTASGAQGGSGEMLQ